MALVVLTAISFLLAGVVYAPLFHRILSRKHTADFSIPSQWAIFALQCNNLIIALREHAAIFIAYYIMQVISIGTVNILIHKYYGAKYVDVQAEQR